MTAASPDVGRFAGAMADYQDSQVCSLVPRQEAQDPPLRAQIGSESLSA